MIYKIFFTSGTFFYWLGLKPPIRFINGINRIDSIKVVTRKGMCAYLNC
jgi:hypothetical protein